MKLYQRCSAGLVEDKTKYGSPTPAASSARMLQAGLSPTRGFQAGPGVIGEGQEDTRHSSEASAASRAAIRIMPPVRPDAILLPTWTYPYPASKTMCKKNMQLTNTAGEPPNQGRQDLTITR